MKQNKTKEIRYLIELYKKETGRSEIDMKELASFAISKGWEPPKPITAEERLAKELARAAREVTRSDKETGQHYRVYHAVKFDQSGQGSFWVDIDEAKRPHMIKSAYARREQVVGDMLQLTLDLDHWNRVNPNEEPIIIETDVTPDIEERLAFSGTVIIR